MRVTTAFSAFVFLLLAGCGPAAAPSQADAQEQAAGAGAGASGELTAADRTALLAAIGLTADAQGQVVNECGDKVTPDIKAAEMGGDVGTAQLIAISGGPSAYTCYGDGPDLHLLMRDGAGWREIYSARGRVLVILPGMTRGVHDIADGGPGFSFPLWQWNGRVFASTGRSIADSETANATMLP